MNEHPYWWDTLPARPADAGAAVPSRVDVVVVGGGYTGLAAALLLASRGVSVVVLERERIGWGASSRNGGQVLTGMKLDPATLVARFGESGARELFGIGLESVAELERLIVDESIPCEYERSGHIQAAWKPAHFDAMREEQALLAGTFDYHVELVEREAQRAEIGSDRYHGLLVDERSGAINPAQYVHGLGAAARRRGAVVVEHAPVSRIERRGNGWTVTAGSLIVHAADVLVATNGYTGAATPALQRRFVPIGSYVIATARLDEDVARSILPTRRMAFDSKHFLFYFRITSDRRLLFGGRAEFSRPTEGATRRAAAILREGMTTVFPQLRGVPIEYAWSGNVAFTRDQMPRAGRLEGMYYAGGYCGHGVAMATFLGSLVARRIAGERMEHPLFDDDFPPIPLYRGNPWFLPVVGAYYRALDFIE